MDAKVRLEEMKFSYEEDVEVSIINVIRTRLLRRGEGTDKDPIRRIEQFWSINGELLWEIDPLKDEPRKKGLRTYVKKK